MNIDPAASGKLCSVLTSGALLLFEGSRRTTTNGRDGEPNGAHPVSFTLKRRVSLPASVGGGSRTFLNSARGQFVFLLLYLTRMVILDNRHGLP
jgi:hypothetical protein